MNGPNNNIGWTDYTINPISGCLHDCTFGPDKTPCYAFVIAERFRGSKAFPNGFEPTFHPSRLKELRKVKVPARIFVCSMADFFGGWVERAHQDAVLAAMADAPWHTYQLLTKAPWNVAKLGVRFAPNVWVGATITGELANEDTRMACVRAYPAAVRFVSVEPLCGPVDLEPARPDWIIIGAATGKGAFQPKREWVERVIDYANRAGVPVYVKDNLEASMRAWGLPVTHDFPAGHTKTYVPVVPPELPLFA